jgi:sterol desaturase/sphingolipid hydroxylase (fatty acid hydroxylase superfamily)
MFRVLRHASWPALVAGTIALTATGRQVSGLPDVVVFNTVYLGLAAALFFLERLLPFERGWLADDGEVGTDLAHTVFNKGIAQVLLVVGAAFGVAELVASEGAGLWPEHWPLALQIALGLLIAEIGLYAAHRMAHELPLLWRFHAVHHSATRLWFFNTGRFHVVDTMKSIALSQPLLFLAGAPVEVFQWVSMVTAYLGMLTHCNVDMRLGPLNLLVNSPELHRWHHSMEIREGNRNYGENLMVFDHAFGTWLLPAARPPAMIGIREAMPRGFLGQLVQPFRSRQPPSIAADADAAALPGRRAL